MRKLFILPFLVLMSFQAWSQFFIGGGHFNGGFPFSKLKKEVNGTFFPSLSGVLLYELAAQPVQIGLELGYGIYGTKLEKRTDLYPGFTDEYRLRRNNNYATGMAVFRFFPSISSRVSPFFEAQIGTNYLYTRFKIRPSRFEDVVEDGKDLEEWALGYKAGAGVQFPVPGIDGAKLEFRITYQDGSSLRFLTRDDTSYLPDQGDGEFDYSPRRSPMQLITASVGIVVYDVFR